MKSKNKKFLGIKRVGREGQPLEASKMDTDSDLTFPTIIKMIKKLYGDGTRIITTKRIRKLFKIASENRKQIKKILRALQWLEKFGYLELERKNPNRYRILPSFQENAEDLIRMYRPRLSGVAILGRTNREKMRD